MAKPFPVLLTEQQIRTLVETAFAAGAAAGSTDPLGVDLEAIEAEREDAVFVALAAIEGRPSIVTELPAVLAEALSGGAAALHGLPWKLKSDALGRVATRYSAGWSDCLAYLAERVQEGIHHA